MPADACSIDWVKKLQDETRTIYVFWFGAPYIRGLCLKQFTPIKLHREHDTIKHTLPWIRMRLFSWELILDFR